MGEKCRNPNIVLVFCEIGLPYYFLVTKVIAFFVLLALLIVVVDYYENSISNEVIKLITAYISCK